MTFRQARFVVPTLAVLLIACRHAASVQNPVPADLTAFLEKGRAALASGNPEALRALAEKPDTLRWLAHRARPGDTAWKLHLLQAPVNPSLTPNAQRQTPHVAVFSAFHSTQSISDHVHRLVKGADGWRLGAEVPEYETLGYRVRDHRLTVRFDLPAATAYFTDHVTVERTTAQPGDPCLLRLSANLGVDSVTRSGKPVPASTVPGVILFRPPDGADRRFDLDLTYHGAFTQPGMDTYVKTTEVFLNAYWYPHIGRLPAKHGVTVTVPKGWTAVGQGELVRREEKGETTHFTFRHEIPTSYFSLDAGPYVITTREVDGRKLSTYQLRANPQDAKAALDEVERSMAVFERSYGPFPYSHYELVQTLGPFGGALEAYSFATFQGPRYGAVTHELAHTWWGGVVPNPYTRSLWNESFASYSDGFAQRQTAATRPARALRGMHAAPSYGRLQVQAYGVPIVEAFDTESPTHNAVGYGKGALVLAMLEDELGTETMVRSMRRFRDDHPAGEAADWAEFERAVRNTTGKDYRWFFEQWTERGGVPIVRLANVKTAQQGGRTVVTAQIVQEGKPYRLDLPLVLEMRGGSVLRQTVHSEAGVTTVTLPAAAAPVALRLDPEGNVLLAGGKGAEDPFSHTF